MKSTGNAVLIAALAMGVALAPAAQAAPRPDTGVGPVIAAQGNLALDLIKAEVVEAIRSWRPTLDRSAVKPEAKAEGKRVASRAGSGVADTARCAP